MSDQKLNQLKSYLDSYLTIARAALGKPATDDLVLYFLTAPPDFVKIHCSISNFRTLTILNGEFYYNGPSSAGIALPQLYYMKNGTLVPVLKFTDYFNATLISVNPEYLPGRAPTIKATDAVIMDNVSKSGDELTGPLSMPIDWVPINANELVTKSYVDQLRLDLEQRIGALESNN